MAKQVAARADKKPGKPAPKKPLLARKPADTGRKQEAKSNVFQRLWAYLKYVRIELRKVIWPKRDEVIQSTIIVIITLIAVGLYVTALDALFEAFINMISGGYVR